MAQTVYLTTPPLGLPTFPATLGVPTSPDPTPLRMLAFSVAEAALENDPNSPSFLHVLREDPAHMASIDAALSQALAAEAESVKEKQKARWSGTDWNLVAAKTNLWDVVEKAKERRQASPAPARAKTPPLTPASYKFVMPAHSPLAASIERTSRPARLATGRPALETRSAEPSPTSYTFAGLDQTRPPPEFVPRLSAEEFSAQSKHISSAKHVRTKSDETLRAVMTESGSSSGGGRGSTRALRIKAPLPSLKQIQAKLSQERTAGSPDAKVAVVSRPNGGVQRTNSDDSVEVLQTPTDERPSLAILSRRPATPPSPQQQQPPNDKTKLPTPAPAAARLAPFLRERTSGRLAQGVAGSAGSRSSISSTPPPKRPVLTVTPPSCERRRPLARLDLISPSRATSVPPPVTPLLNRRVVTSPTGSRFPALSDLARYSPRTPSSPTGSAGGSLSPGSMPIITCTPAPAKIVKDGVEHDSDEECDEVVVFDGEQEEARERQERERRATQMKERLRLRRSSD